MFGDIARAEMFGFFVFYSILERGLHSELDAMAIIIANIRI